MVLLETVQGDHLLVQILFVFDEGDTPDLFCLEVIPSPEGYVAKGTSGLSILLADILRVQSPPA